MNTKKLEGKAHIVFQEFWKNLKIGLTEILTKPTIDTFWGIFWDVRTYYFEKHFTDASEFFFFQLRHKEINFQKVKEMAALSSLFPSYTPQLSNKLWFNCESSSTISSDADLQKEEEEYIASLKEEVSIKLIAVGQTKEETEQTGNI